MQTSLACFNRNLGTNPGGCSQASRHHPRHSPLKHPGRDTQSVAHLEESNLMKRTPLSLRLLSRREHSGREPRKLSLFVLGLVVVASGSLIAVPTVFVSSGQKGSGSAG